MLALTILGITLAAMNFTVIIGTILIYKKK